MKDLSHKPTLTGHLVTLRPVTVDDAEAMIAIMADPEVGRLTGSVSNSADLGVAPPLEGSRDWYGSRGATDDRLDLAVVDKATRRLVGEAVLNCWDPDARSVSFRTLIGPEGRGRGLGTEATRLLVRYAFDELGMHRVGLEVFDFNPRARHVYEKLGFVHEGTRRHALCFDGDWIDAHDMSILEHEWATHRGNL
ncbi:GNAT family N-acetyltransferase [Micromonospora parathelypteridis]|uniref:RimJ/RimL family protein N-acetyltransferase n=1 Tax=Micromonospora parathelypteridis TaxID=1839617 RepID=A0A840VHB9_9ACTN|nr:GNAT family protein [Micromonospora parathelypteridis]MBB5476147.1 RimJ/RimL family protein N-acetyltransferase [Micromonospora parathelypteridis]GGO13613.1 acetyltransferase [Micromonospora parathelypteridis]